MPRPCECDKCDIGLPYKISQCRLCWLYHHDERYRNMWGNPLKPTMPSTITQAVNFAVALKNRIEGKFKNVSDENYKQRMSICENCPNRTEDWRCTKCGCYLNLKAKWQTEKCPENKWPLLMVEENKGCGCGTKK